MPSSLASTLGRKALCPPTLIPRKKTIKAMLPIVAAPKYRGEAEAVGPDDRECVVAQRLPSFPFAICDAPSVSRTIRELSRHVGKSPGNPGGGYGRTMLALR